MSRILTVTSGLAVTVAVLTGSATHAAARPTAINYRPDRAFTVLSAPVPRFPSGPVYAVVQADPLSDPSSPVLARVRVSGSQAVIRVPASSQVKSLAQVNGGTVNLMLNISNGREISTTFVPARAYGSTTARESRVSYRAAGPSLTRVLWVPRPHQMPRPQPVFPGQCVTIKVRYRNNKSTRIGELHVASISDMNGEYDYTTQADSSMSIGISTNDKNFTFGGSVEVTNSIGAGGADPHGAGTDVFVNDHMNYSKVWNSCGQEIVGADSSNGDVYDGHGTPPHVPWVNCLQATYFAYVPPNGGKWEGDNSHAATLSWDYSAFGNFTGSGSTGYITTNRISYVNKNHHRTGVVCGRGGNSEGLDGSPVFWETGK